LLAYYIEECARDSGWEAARGLQKEN